MLTGKHLLGEARLRIQFSDSPQRGVNHPTRFKEGDFGFIYLGSVYDPTTTLRIDDKILNRDYEAKVLSTEGKRKWSKRVYEWIEKETASYTDIESREIHYRLLNWD